MWSGKTIAYRVAVISYLAVIALIPWSTFPPFPWIHRHAQWSDAVLLVSGAAWLWATIRKDITVKWTPARVAVLAYVGWVVVAGLFAESPAASTPLVAGVAGLALLFLITSMLEHDLVASETLPLVVAISSLAVGLAAIAGFVLFLLGHETLLVGSYGAELIVSPNYARVQAAYYHPALLGSYCIFASSLVAALPDSKRGLRRITQAVLGFTVVLTISRALLGFLLAALIRAQKSVPAARRLAWLMAVISILLLVVLSLGSLTFDPSRPWASGFSWQPHLRGQAILPSVETFARDPLTGLGPGTNVAVFTAERTREQVVLEAHVTPLNVAATLGLPALIALAVALAAMWKGRGRPTDLLIWGGLAGLGIDALGQDVERFRHVWVLLGLADGNARDRSLTDEFGLPALPPEISDDE